MISISEITDRQIWEDFIDKHCITTFMQSWDFGIFEINTGHKVKRVALSDSNNILAICQIIVIHAKKGSFLYIPHGPVFHKDIVPVESYTKKDYIFPENQKDKLRKIFTCIYEFTKVLANSEKCHFVRFNASLPDNLSIRNCSEYHNRVFSPIYLTSENGCVLDLSLKDTGKIMSNMRKTTRYSIRKAEKESVTVRQLPKSEFFDVFLRLYEETAIREKFTGFSKEYLYAEFEAFEKDNRSIALVAFHNETPTAAGLFIMTKNCLFYHQGASNHPTVPAPYLLQWEAIKIAIENNCKYYNLWGTYIPGRTPSSWQGLSLFKHGFGTQTWAYIPTFDLVIDWRRYIFTYLTELLIRLQRGV